MIPVNEVDLLLKNAHAAKISENFSQHAIPFLDLTSLNDNDNNEVITTLCDKGKTRFGTVATICVYPVFVEVVKKHLGATAIKICTVANFPQGSTDLQTTVNSIRESVNKGAAEIDIVMPYRAYMNGETAIVSTFIQECKNACGTALLKVILETGVLADSDLIYKASILAIASGADFIKTSTGKVAINATLEAAIPMLFAIKDASKPVGIKAAGGIRTKEQAAGYFALAAQIMGKDWLTPQNFRLGASSLLDDLLS